MEKLIKELKEMADNLLTANGCEDCSPEEKEHAEAYEKASHDIANQLLEVIGRYEK
jgi:hypothetical protein